MTPNTHSVRKGNLLYFGYKSHIGVDKDSELWTIVNKVDKRNDKSYKTHFRLIIRKTIVVRMRSERIVETMDIVKNNDIVNSLLHILLKKTK